MTRWNLIRIPEHTWRVDELTIWLLSIPVIAAGIYLMVLGGAAIFTPVVTKTFLAGFASSARAHFLELFIRLGVGVALVLLGPEMRFPRAFALSGWVLVVTTLGLFAIPWRVHYRFAQWSVPMATRNMLLFGAASMLGGVALLLAVIRY